MNKLNYAQAKSKFKNDEDIISYFILVESYEPHLKSNQQSFLKPDSIDSMLEMLDEKQLKHLKSLLNVFYNNKYTVYEMEGQRVDGLSKWFKENVLENPNKKIAREECREISKKLIDKVSSVERKKLDLKEHLERLRTQYKARLSKFGGNSVEYREWLALMVKDHGIPDIEKIYDITKLLRRLTIRYLKKLEDNFERPYILSIIEGIKYLEPYLYYLATSDIKDLDYIKPDNVSFTIKKDNPEYKAFEVAVKDLYSKIQSVLKEKGVDKNLFFAIRQILAREDSYCGANCTRIRDIKYLIEDKNASSGADKELALQIKNLLNGKDVYKIWEDEATKLVSEIEKLIQGEEKEVYIDDKINGLKTSSMFYEDVQDILRAVGADERQLKDAIAEYSKPGVQGRDFNDYLKKAAFLKEVSSGRFTAPNITSFRNKMLKVRQYFLNHLTSKEYTVYRGISLDRFRVILQTANPKLVNITPCEWEEGENCETHRAKEKTRKDNLIKEINEKKPVVYDEGFASTSINKGVSAQAFKGKNLGNVFFTIKIPPRSRALVLDYEGIVNVPKEEEVLLAERTRTKIESIKAVDGHYEIDATVVG